MRNVALKGSLNVLVNDGSWSGSKCLVPGACHLSFGWPLEGFAWGEAPSWSGPPVTVEKKNCLVSDGSAVEIYAQSAST